MNVQTNKPESEAIERQLPFECVALVLQGGGALGAIEIEHGGALARRLSRCSTTLRHPEVLKRPKNLEGLFSFDLAQDGRE